MPADAVRRATLTLRLAEGSAQTHEACFTSLTMRRTQEGGYARPAISCQIDPKKVAASGKSSIRSSPNAMPKSASLMGRSGK